MTLLFGMPDQECGVQDNVIPVVASVGLMNTQSRALFSCACFESICKIYNICKYVNMFVYRMYYAYYAYYALYYM